MTAAVAGIGGRPQVARLHGQEGHLVGNVGLQEVLGIVGRVSEQDHVAQGGLLPGVVGVLEEGLQARGTRFSVPKLLVHLFHGHGLRREALALAKGHQRLGGGQEGSGRHQQPVRLVPVAPKTTRNRRAHLRGEHRTRRRREVTVVGLGPEARPARPCFHSAKPRDAGRGVDHQARTPKTRDLGRSGLPEGALDPTRRGHQTARVAHLVPVQEDHGVGRTGVSHVLQGQGVGPFLEDARRHGCFEDLLCLPVPGDLAHHLPVQRNPQVVVGAGLEVTSALQPHLDPARTRRRSQLVQGEGVALAHRRDQKVPQPQIGRLQDPCLVELVLLVGPYRPPAPWCPVPTEPRGPRASEHARLPDLELVDHVPVRVLLSTAHEIEGGSGSKERPVRLHVVGHGLSASGKAKARKRHSTAARTKHILEPHPVQALFLGHELGHHSRSAQGRLSRTASSRTSERLLSRFLAHELHPHQKASGQHGGSRPGVVTQGRKRHPGLLRLSLERRSLHPRPQPRVVASPTEGRVEIATRPSRLHHALRRHHHRPRSCSRHPKARDGQDLARHHRGQAHAPARQRSHESALLRYRRSRGFVQQARSPGPRGAPFRLPGRPR